jgi:hypothetical protein
MLLLIAALANWPCNLCTFLKSAINFTKINFTKEMLGIRTPPRNTSESLQQQFQYSYQQPHQNYGYPQQAQYTQKTGFMGSIATIYSDYESNLSHKRRMQEVLAENLRKQIEEKKSRSQMEPSTRRNKTIRHQATELMYQKQNIAPAPLNTPSKTQPVRRVSFDFTQNNTNKSAKTQPRTYNSKPAYVPYKFNQYVFTDNPMPRINVSTESPFAHQNVTTPPLGFSVRNISSLRKSYPGNQQAFNGGMKNTFNRTMPAQPNQTFKNTNRVVPGPMRSGRSFVSTSEMIFPDGRIEACLN